jgi:hypothetical protein
VRRLATEDLCVDDVQSSIIMDLSGCNLCRGEYQRRTFALIARSGPWSNEANQKLVCPDPTLSAVRCLTSWSCFRVLAALSTKVEPRARQPTWLCPCGSADLECICSAFRPQLYVVRFRAVTRADLCGCRTINFPQDVCSCRTVRRVLICAFGDIYSGSGRCERPTFAAFAT